MTVFAGRIFWLLMGLILAGGAWSADVADFECESTSGNCPARIPDAGGAESGLLTTEVMVPASPCGSLSQNASGGVAVNLEAIHTNLGDLRVTLVSPSGVRFELMRRIPDDSDGPEGSCAGDDMVVSFRDGNLALPGCGHEIPAVTGEAASFTSLLPLTGPIATGAYSLEITDEAPGGNGLLQDWSIVFFCALLDTVFADGFEIP